MYLPWPRRIVKHSEQLERHSWQETLLATQFAVAATSKQDGVVIEAVVAVDGHFVPVATAASDFVEQRIDYDSGADSGPVGTLTPITISTSRSDGVRIWLINTAIRIEMGYDIRPGST